jgi:hypothetical protein
MGVQGRFVVGLDDFCIPGHALHQGEFGFRDGWVDKKFHAR